MTRSNNLLLAIALFCVSTGYAQNVGIGTTTPGTKLTVAGGIASTPVSAAAAASVTIPSNASIFYLTAVSGSRTDALTMSSPTAGQYLTIYNLDGNPATFAGYTITASTGVMTFQYINGTWQAVSDNSFIGGSNYVKNQTAQQASSNFNISGNGVIGGTATVSSLSTAGVVTNSSAGLLGTTSLVPTAYGGMGANMTAGAIGAIPYATSTTAYGSLAAVATGSYLRSAGTGTAPIWSTVTLPNAATTGDIWYASASNTMTALSDVAAGALLVSGGVGTAPSWISSTGTGVQGYWTRSGATLYNTNTGDNVGIGTSSPQARLHVITTGNQSGGSLAAWSGLEAVIGPGTASGSQPALGFAYDVANTVGTIYSLAPNVAWENLALRANTIAMYGSGSNLGLYVNASGYVGVGTASPVARLTVAGDGTGTAYIGGNFCGTNYTGISLNGLIGSCSAYNMLSSPTDENLYLNRPTGYSIRLRENNGDEVTIASGGYVGIGTTTPAKALHVIASSNSDGILIQNTAGGSGSQANLYFETYSGETIAGADIAGIDDGSYSAHLAFSTRVPGSSTNALAERMRLSSAGYLGIGTTTPGYPLDVEITSSNNTTAYAYINGLYGATTFSGNITYAGGGGYGSGNATGANVVSLYLVGRLFQRAGEIDFGSDKRIKDIIGQSSGSDDLATLCRVQVTDFTYKDMVENGTKPKKAFIAQQVESVFPEAVTYNTDFIPDVYARDTAKYFDAAHGTCTIYLAKNHGLVVGDTIRIISDRGKTTTSVTDVPSASAITVRWDREPSDLMFVYGRQVHDFRAVDYDRIYNLNVSATQELAKQLHQEQMKNQQLEQELADVKKQGKTYQSDIDHLKASVETLQQIMQSKAEK